MVIEAPTEVRPPRPALTLDEALWGSLALLLVPAYVNTIAIWHWLEASLPNALLAVVPMALAMVLFGVTVVRFRDRVARHSRHLATWLLIAALLALLVWLLVDARFPAKRVHLFQYALLALIARQFFRRRLDEPWACLAGALAAAVLGVHDELLQGLHPGRYFAINDVVVNTLAAGSGGALAYAVAGDGAAARPRRAPPGTRDWAAIGVSLVGLAGISVCLEIDGPSWRAVAFALLPLAITAGTLTASDRALADGGPRLAATIAVLSTLAVAAPAFAILFDLEFA